MSYFAYDHSHETARCAMKSSLKRVITALLAAVMLAAIPCVPAFGAQEYYVNDGENTLALADANAIGADGSTAKLPERGVYAATASGTQLLGGSEYRRMSSRTFQTVSSASVWPSARRRWMRSICRSRPVPASPSDTMTPIVCSSPSVRQRRAPSPLLRYERHGWGQCVRRLSCPARRYLCEL